MIRVVDDKSVIIGRFESRPTETISRLESMGAVVLESKSSSKGYLLVAVTEPDAKGEVLGYIASQAEKTYDPIGIEIRGFDKNDNPFEDEYCRG